jgi:hypothetical protein
MKAGTSGHDTTDAHWLRKSIARLADTEAKACIDDTPFLPKGGGGNHTVLRSGFISRRFVAKPVHASKTRFRLPLALRRGISTSTTTRNQ